ncbi:MULTISPECIES: hypothetical protein [Bacteroidaceae]|jgi:hypothetical protein|uniref:hypothetical protein n=1 Tax=Bacteroidaceae TaxID=815 RepID=UPI0008DA2134|nr:MULTISPECIES: hypothetical protein [Bacteroides]
MKRNERPTIDNPLANMGLDQIVRGITQPKTLKDIKEEQAQDEKESPEKKTKTKRTSKKLFEENIVKYTGVGGQGEAIWLPKEVKKELEKIRVNSNRNIPLRTLASAIIMTYIEENKEKLENL